MTTDNFGIISLLQVAGFSLGIAHTGMPFIRKSVGGPRYRHTGQIENKHFRDIMDYFDDKDVFVVNNTKVFPARMYGRKEKTGAKIEVFLLRESSGLNYGEIADACGLTEDAVRARLQRARQALRVMLHGTLQAERARGVCLSGRNDS